MPKRIAYRNLPALLLKVRENILAQFRPIISHFGLTEQQWRILRMLDEMGEIEQRELSEACQILSPSLTGILSRMEEIGLISRTRMAEDQRRVTVRISPLGEKIVEAMSPLVTQQYRNVAQAYGPELMDELFEVMDKFLAAEPAIAQVKLPDPSKMDPAIVKMLK
jgi:homoprotocatechuate degradation regulator HpaR